MSRRLKLAVLLAVVAGGLAAVAIGMVHGQSITQQSTQQSCGPMMSNARDMGMMGGMGGLNHSGSMSQDMCNANIRQHDVGQCQGFMASTTTTQSYGMIHSQNANGRC